MSLITHITIQKKNKNRCSIFINNEYYCSASAYVIAKNNIQVNQHIDTELLNKIIFEDDLEKAKGYIVDYHLNKTQHEIITKLRNKTYSDEVINEIISFLNKYNLADDFDYAKRYSHDALFIHKKGIKVIENKLKQKGVDKLLIDKALSFIEDKEVETLNKIIEKIINKYVNKSKSINQLKQSVYQSCIQKGFRRETIESVFANINFDDFTIQEEDVEYDKLQLYYEKALKKYENKSKSQYQLKMKIYQYLSTKGFSSEIISEFLNNNDIIPED